jgi:RNase P protein component
VKRVTLKSGQDYVIIASRDVLEVPFDLLVAWLEMAVGRE